MEAAEKKTEGAVVVEEEDRGALNLKMDLIRHSVEQSLMMAFVPNHQAHH